MKKTDFFVLFYFILASCYATYPLVFHLSEVIPHSGDELLVTWIFSWNIHSFFTNPLGIYDTNIFYPYKNTLAYSESFLTSSVIGIIPWILFKQPIAVYNFVLLFSYSFLGFAVYLLTKYITKSTYASLVSGTLVAFSTYTITKTMHLQLVNIGFVPLSLLFFLKFSQSNKTSHFVLCCFFLFLQAANSFLPVYFLGVCYAFFLIYFFVYKKIYFLAFFQRKVYVISLITALLLIPVALPYINVAKEFQFTRDIRDAIHFANRPEYTLFPSDRTRLQSFFLETFYKTDTNPFKYDGYIGLAFFILIIFSVVFYYTKIKKSLMYFYPFFFLGILSFVLSLGPVFQWGGKVIKWPFMIPLPYALFYYIVPGFKGMRNSARWEMLFIIAGSIVIGIVLAFLFKTKLKKWQIPLTIAICFLVFIEIPLPMPIFSVPKKEEIPQTYYYLQSLPKDAVLIQMPIYVWYMAPYATDELYRQYYSTVEFRNRVNGGSGFSPLPWEKQASDLLINFPNDWSIKKLQSIGVTHVVVHGKDYKRLFTNGYKVQNTSIPSFEKIRLHLDKEKRVKLLKIVGTDYIYQLL